MNGSVRLKATLVRRSAPAVTVTDAARRTRITASTCAAIQVVRTNPRRDHELP